jgi:hypothetical protein
MSNNGRTNEAQDPQEKHSVDLKQATMKRRNKGLLNSCKNIVLKYLSWTYMNKHGSVMCKFREAIPELCNASVTVGGGV